MSYVCRPCHPDWYPGETGACGCLVYCGEFGCDASGVVIPASERAGVVRPTDPASVPLPEGIELGEAEGVGPVPSWRVDSSGLPHLVHAGSVHAICGWLAVMPLVGTTDRACRVCYKGAPVKPELPFPPRP